MTMLISVEIHPTRDTREGFALTNLVRADGARLCVLDIQYSRLAVLSRPHPVAVDFLLLAASVYAMDKLVPRDLAGDGWTREFVLTLPVSDPATWQRVRNELNTCLAFLTGDSWTVDFRERPRNPIRARKSGRRLRTIVPLNNFSAVCLFSGGLDSLVGAINRLEDTPNEDLLLVGHHERTMPGPLSDQERLLSPLQAAYPKRVHALLPRIGYTGEQAGPAELTLRGRSLIFVALGVFGATADGAEVPLIIPENGTIALNVPLTPSRRGSCSTRTAHPYYIAMLQGILTDLGFPNRLSNPLQDQTKGEVVLRCLNQNLLKSIAILSVSCAKRGHKRNWTNKGARGCGHCMPCIYRRAALHAAGWDNETYGDDICRGEVDLQGTGQTGNDIRACFSFLRRTPDQRIIESTLMASGRLEVARLSDYAKTIQRAMDEIRQLIEDKGTAKIKSAAAVGNR
jgi:hypothetical protein